MQSKYTEGCVRAVILTNWILQQLNTDPEAYESVGNGTAAYEASQPVPPDQLQYMPQAEYITSSTRPVAPNSWEMSLDSRATTSP